MVVTVQIWLQFEYGCSYIVNMVAVTVGVWLSVSLTMVALTLCVWLRHSLCMVTVTV